MYHSRKKSSQITVAAGIVIIGLVLAYAHVARAEITETPERALTMVANELKDTLSDPASASFRNVGMAQYDGKPVVCGQINGRNAYGGMVGWTSFIWTWPHGVDIGFSDPRFANAWGACLDRVNDPTFAEKLGALTK